jgi:hypothetical protein
MSTPDTLRQVEFGSAVTVELIDRDGHAEPLTVVIVAERAADLDRGLLGENAPLARAILGQFVGTVVAYQMGDVQQVRIVQAQRVDVTAEDTAARRAAVLEKAREDAARTNAEMFAASFSGKWGNYDAG